MTRREVPDSAHGTTTGYGHYECRCDRCRAAATMASREWRNRNPEKAAAGTRRWRQANREKYNEQQRQYRAENREYELGNRRDYRAKLQAESRTNAPRWRRWEPHEDALLARIPSNIAAASALGRTYHAVELRRMRLRARAARIEA